MVHIVIGNINTGKTTWLKKRFDHHGLGAGVLGVKLWKDGDIYGYKAHLLPSGQEEIILIHQRHYNHEFENFGMIGPYFYNLDAFNHINQHIIEAIDRSVSPIYVDEVGKLEISGGGYDPVIKKIALSQGESYISSRRDLAQAIIEHYRLTNYKIIEIEDKAHV